MASDTVNQVVGQQAFDEVKGMNEALKELVVTMNDAANKAKTIQISIKGDTNITELTKQMQELKNMSASVNGSMAALSAAQQAEAAAARAQADATKAAAQAAKDAQVVHMAEVKNSRLNEQQTRKLQQAIASLTRERDKAAAQAAKDANAYEQLKREYAEAANGAKQLAAEYFNLQRSGKASADQLMAMSASVRAANERALGLSKGLYEIERAVGQSQRNVGNYNALMFETNQLLREAPNFALSARIGLMALSNNLPMFAEQFRNASRAIDDNTGKVKGWKGALKDVGKSIFSWQTLLIVGITLMLQYGDKLTALFNTTAEATKRNEEFKKSIKDINDESNKNVVQEQSRMNILTAIAKDNTLSMENRVKAVRELQETYPKTFGALTKQAILEGNLKSAVDNTTESILKRAQAQAAERAIATTGDVIFSLTEKYDTEFKRLGEMQKEYNQFTQAIANGTQKNITAGPWGSSATETISKAVETQRKKVMQLGSEIGEYVKKQEEYAQKVKDAGGDIFGNDKLTKTPKPADNTNRDLSIDTSMLELDKNLYVQLQKEQMAHNKAMYEDQSAGLMERLDAYNRYVENKINISRAESGLEKAEAQLRLDKIAELENISEGKRTKQENDLIAHKGFYNKQIELLTRQQASVEEEILTESGKEKAKIGQQYAQGQINEFNRQFEAIRSANAAEVATNLSDLEKRHQAGLISDKKRWKERTEIISDGSKDLFNWQAEYVQELFDKVINDPTVDQKVKDFVINLQGQFENAKRSPNNGPSILEMLGFSSTPTEGDKAAIGEWTQNLRKSISDSIKGLYDSIFQAIDQARDAHYQREFDLLDAERQKIEDNAAAEKNAIDGSLLSQEEKAKKEAEIAARQHAQEIALDNKKKQLQRQQAQQAKEDAIFKISIEGAIAISKTLAGLATVATAPYAIAAAALIAAQTAAQIALISSRPIPEYWKGTGDHFGGIALVGERGAERVNLPSGKSFLTPNKPTLMNLPKHTEVLTHSETMREFEKDRELRSMAGLNSQSKFNSLFNNFSMTRELYSSSRIAEMNNEVLAREAQKMSVIQMGMLQQTVNENDYAKQMVANFEDAINKQTKKIISSISNKQELYFHWDDGELKKSIKNGNATTKYMGKFKKGS